MVQCTECGARNSESSTFCVRCGAAVGGAGTQLTETVGSDTDRIDPVAPEPAAEAEPELQVQATLVMEPAAATPDDSPEALLAQAADLMGEGRPDDAAARCREAIKLAPDMIAAYSMLGMAEEQRGNPIAAAGAYRRVLQLDPSRSAEREKLELLYSTGVERHHEPGPERGGEAGVRVWMSRWAPAIVAAAGVFFTVMVLTGIILHVRGARIQQRSYEENMAAAEVSLDERDYAAAIRAFEAALAVRPDDTDARTGVEYARRKLDAATAQPTMTAAAAAPFAPILPSAGPNPFQPVPIGPTVPGEPVAAQQLQPQQSTPRATRPPVVNSDIPIVGTSGSGSSATGGGSIPFDISPLDPGDEQPQPPVSTGTAEAPPEPEVARRRPEITIWAAEPPVRPAGGQQTGTSTAPAGAGHGQRAATLRQQGDQLRAAGQGADAAQAYGAAIEAYRAQSEAEPATRDANEAAIRALERARGLCQNSQGQ